jgi:putative membrane protein
VLGSTTSLSDKQLLLASALQPISGVILFLPFLTAVNYFHMLLFLVLSMIIGYCSVFYFVSIINHVGDSTLGIASLSLFKAFLMNWILGLNAPFEVLLEELGEEKDVEVALLKFDTSKPKAIMVVPSIHPGPFKNVGSSLLPSMIKDAIEKETGYITSVPHGLFGHELDLASQFQNQKIIKKVVNSSKFPTSITHATPFLRFNKDIATVCCQLFGNFAFLSFTLAPRTTEDLPQELGNFVQKEAAKYGLDECIVVNAHNSINGEIDTQKALSSLESAAVQCLEKVSTLPRLPFQVGAATIIPKDFSLKEGMGPGGVTVTVIKVGEQETAYVVIDGNNMVSGLREDIISALQFEGINESEVLTTDTHSVTALILTGRGYHPIGEAIDHQKLIAHIKRATYAARSNLESAKADANKITVSKVKVIGEKRLEALSLLVDKTIQKAKRVSIPLFTMVCILLLIFLMFL